MNYFGLEETDYASPNTAKVAILPVPYESTVSYGGGTAAGPQAVNVASQQVELFDEELKLSQYKIGIETLAPLDLKPVKADNKFPFGELSLAVEAILDKKQFPIVLGGEHSLSLGPIRAVAQRYKDLSILHIDAHADLRESYDGNPYSHASAAYQFYHVLENPNLVQVGIRNISEEEHLWLEKTKPNIHTFYDYQRDSWNFPQMIDLLSDNVYLTIDVDGLDSAIMPATGTPEPGGVTWHQVTALIRQLAKRKNIVAMDVVELAPIKSFHAPDFLVAKLIYKTIGYKFENELKKLKQPEEVKSKETLSRSG